MRDYSSLSDEALQRLSKGEDSEAETYLVSRYTKLVRACARPLFLAGGDSEDLIQEGMIGLLSAIRSFEPDQDASFRTYAQICIRRRQLTAIKSALRDKHAPLNNYISLESLFMDHSQSVYFLRDLEEEVLAKESADELSNKFIGYLSGFEAEILQLYLEGLSYEEMSVKVERPPKSVDNAVQRIRRKLSRYLKTGDISSG